MNFLSGCKSSTIELPCFCTEVGAETAAAAWVEDEIGAGNRDAEAADLFGVGEKFDEENVSFETSTRALGTKFSFTKRCIISVPLESINKTSPILSGGER